MANPDTIITFGRKKNTSNDGSSTGKLLPLSPLLQMIDNWVSLCHMVNVLSDLICLTVNRVRVILKSTYLLMPIAPGGA